MVRKLPANYQLLIQLTDQLYNNIDVQDVVVVSNLFERPMIHILSKKQY